MYINYMCLRVCVCVCMCVYLSLIASDHVFDKSVLRQTK